MEKYGNIPKNGQGNWREGEKSTPSLALSTLKQEALSDNWISSGRKQSDGGDEEGENMAIVGEGTTENGPAEIVLGNTENYGDVDLHVSTSEGTSVLDDSDDDLYHPEWIPLYHVDEAADVSDDVRESLSSRTEGGVGTRDRHPTTSYQLFQAGGKHKCSAIPESTSYAEKRKYTLTSMQLSAVAPPHPSSIPEKLKIPLRQQPYTSGRPNLRGGGSLVWRFYILDKREQSKATCKLCGKTISRGKPGSNLGTTSLRSHMNSMHKAIWTRHLASMANSKEYRTNATPSDNNTIPSSPPSNPEGPNGCDVRCEERGSQGNTGRFTASCSEQHPNSAVMATHQQDTVKEAHERETDYDHDVGQVCTLNFQVAKMLAVDMLPYQFVEGRGFRELMSTVAPHWEIPSYEYFAQKAVPQVHNLVMECIGKELEQNECRKVHISASIWTNLQSVDYMVVSAHWVSFHEGDTLAETSGVINKKCKLSSSFRKQAALCMQSFNSREYKPSDVLCKLRGVIETWVSPRNLQVGFVSADSDLNVVAAIHQGGMVHVPCFAHVLNTVVSQFLANSGKMQETLQSARKICSHFHGSPTAQDALLTLQVNNNLPRHPLIAEVGSGWHSTLQMLKRLHEQRKAVNDYIMDFRRPLKGESLTPAQWNLMDAMCTVLQTMEEATLLASHQNACLSQVLPLICLLENRLRTLQDESEQQHSHPNLDSESEFDLPYLAGKLLHCLTTNPMTVSIKQNDEFLLATLLDPRFKDQMARYVIGGQQAMDRCKEVLIQKVIDEERKSAVPSRLKCSSPISCNPPSSVHDAKLEDMDAESNSRDEMGTAGSLWDLLPQYGIVATFDSQERKLQTAAKMVTAYLLDSTFVETHADPLVFWESRRHQWPELSLIAVEYLSCPPSGRCSECSVSGTGDLEQQARLSSLNMDVLMFLKMNQHWIPENYRLKRERRGDGRGCFPDSQSGGNAEGDYGRPFVVKVEDDTELQWH